MKTAFTSLFILLSVTFTKSQNLELPFYENFEETLSNDGIFLNWTTENLAGWHYWHIVPGQHMRFENNDLDQNDWLITKPIITSDADSLIIRFNTLYRHQGTKPKFLYTSEYTGDAQNDTWHEIEYELGDNEEQWISSGDIVIKSPASTVWFAFHSNQEAGQGIYFLLDNFSVSKYEPETITKAGETANFEFYTDKEANTNYWLEIKDALEDRYRNYCGYWNIPGLEDFMDKSKKTKVYFFERDRIALVNSNTPLWKKGFFDRNNYSIYLESSILNTEDNYYDGLQGLALHAFAGYAHKFRLARDRNGYDYSPDYFTEAFGLYEQGYRPNRDSIIYYFEHNPGDLSHELIEKFVNIHNTLEKDIAVSYVEGQILNLLGYRWTEAPYGSYPPVWNSYIKHFYLASETERVQKYAESKNFDIYCASRDTFLLDSIFVWLENTRQFYTDSFQMEINQKYHICIFEQNVGKEITRSDDFNGGSGTTNISPYDFWGGPYDGYNWLLAHEFGHVFNDLMYKEFPFGFYHEGMANLSGGMATGGNEELKSYDDLWKVEYVFNFYKNKLDREPTLEELITNPHAGEPGLEWGADCYFFGSEFIRFLRDTEGYLKIKEFFSSGLDYGVFNNSYEEIEKGYIERLNYLHSIRDYNEPILLKNNSLNVERGKLEIITSDHLQASDQEVKDNELLYKIKTAPLYGIVEKVDNPGVKVYRFTEEEIKNNQIRYVSNGGNEASDFFIFELSDRTFSISNKQFNFSLTTPTGISDFIKTQTDFQIYPNPLTNDSKISFTLKEPEKVELAIFDLQGKKLAVISNQTLTAGYHEFAVEKYITKTGVYFLRLKTMNNTAALKLIVE